MAVYITKFFEAEFATQLLSPSILIGFHVSCSLWKTEYDDQVTSYIVWYTESDHRIVSLLNISNRN